MTAPEPDRLLTTRELADAFRVSYGAASKWAKAGKIASIRTPGGHRRFRESEVRGLLRGGREGGGGE